MFFQSFLCLCLFLISFGLVRTAPAPLPGVGDSSDNQTSTAATTSVSNTTIDSDLVRPAEFSRIAYCSSAAVTSWKCGPPCDAVPGVEVLQSGGDGGDVPLYFIAHDPSTQSVVVAHQGTDSSNILSIANDAEFGLTDFNTTLFPSAPSSVQVHDGFQKTFERTSDSVLSGVQNALKSTGVNKVLVTGHSLGAAIATMDALMFKQNLPSSVELNTVVFGLPRGGNQVYANFIDSALGNSFTFVTNQNDPVPTVPPRFLKFQHSQGEIHIKSVDASTGNATSVVSCPGQENDNCSDGNSLVDVDVSNHIGPYFQNISMSHSNCPL
ncbi:hypothetical protein PILCRDRAFT_811875 [Piloderma croceum F 1598]|uniref:Fungal lipase-type domain-containing protein n=1 Tax=Piloderma croceum (strain F 1598) TaxID=765440 RepID=A0A0C3GEN0_PILCF|nr:hypothetical protein PILCRDRAFT_811875 [Piloderma croceum F 1598]